MHDPVVAQWVAAFWRRWPDRGPTTGRRIGRYVRILQDQHGVAEPVARQVYWQLREEVYPFQVQLRDRCHRCGERWASPGHTLCGWCRNTARRQTPKPAFGDRVVVREDAVCACGRNLVCETDGEGRVVEVCPEGHARRYLVTEGQRVYDQRRRLEGELLNLVTGQCVPSRAQYRRDRHGKRLGDMVVGRKYWGPRRCAS